MSDLDNIGRINRFDHCNLLVILGFGEKTAFRQDCVGFP